MSPEGGTTQGGGTHPGDPWHPDWQSPVPAEDEEEEWPYDETLTLTTAEQEIADLEEDDLEAEPEAELDAEPGPADEEQVEPVPVEESDAAADVDEAVEDGVVDQTATVEEREVAETVELADEVKALDPVEDEAQALDDVEDEVDVEAAHQLEEVAARMEAEQATEAADDVGEVPAHEVATDEVVVVDETSTEGEWAELEILEVDEVDVPAAYVLDSDAGVRLEPEAEEILESSGTFDHARDVDEEVVELAAVDEVAAADLELLADLDEGVDEVVDEADEVVAGDLAGEVDIADAAEVEVDAEDVLELEAVEEVAAGEVEEVEVAEGAVEVPTVASTGSSGDVGMIDEVDDLVLSELEIEEETMAGVDEFDLEELTDLDDQTDLDDLESAEELASDDVFEDLPDDEPVPLAAADTVTPAPTADVIPFEQLEVHEVLEVHLEDLPVEEMKPEFVEVDDADLRADTAEHMFDALSFGEDTTDEMAAAGELTLDETEPELPPEFEFNIPDDYERVSAEIDDTREMLAAYMEPAGDAGDEAAVPESGPELEAGAGEQALEMEQAVEPADEPVPVTPADFIGSGPAEPVPLLTDEGPKTREQEIVAELASELELVDFETFARTDHTGYVQAPTQEHLDLAEALAEADRAGSDVPTAVVAAMPGLDSAHVGFEDLDDDEPAGDGDEGAAAAAQPAEYQSDLALRVASAVILVSLLVAAIWIGGAVFLAFMLVVALTAQVEFYSAVRSAGYRPIALFGLLGGIGAMIGTHIQSTDRVSDGPVAIPAAFALTIVATFAFYSAQENPPLRPWRNGLVTIVGLAWVPLLLAFVIPLNALGRDNRMQLIFVLLVAVAAFDVGSYFVGKALGERKLAPKLSPNKTVEGFVGGTLAVLIMMAIVALASERFTAGASLALAAAVIVAAPLGDLAESLIKRALGLKDMGQLIPGHGGILDRIDSYLFAVPAAYLIFRWTGLI